MSIIKNSDNKESNSLRTIIVPPGIGDFIWTGQKILNSKEKFRVVMPDGTPQRGHQLLDLLPHLIASHEYRSGLNYTKINKENIQNRKMYWKHINEKEFYLSANAHLESGKRIEEFLPDLPTTYKIDYATTEHDALIASETLSDHARRYIGIYTSAYSNARNAGGWGAEEWFKLLKLLYKSTDICFVIIGAPYDVGITEDLTAQMRGSGIPFIDTTGQPLGVVIEFMKRFSYFIGFPSGLSIINETLHKDGVMFYMKKDAGIINTWVQKERIEAGNIKECLFCPAEQIFDWIENEYNLFKKL